MLRKLMKYELKATSRLLVPLYIIILIMSFINRFVFRFNDYEKPMKMLHGFLIVVYIMLIVTAGIATVLYMIIRFYKNLLTDEGYLMFTLPAKTHQHITSKLLITLLWLIVCAITIIASIFIAFADVDSLPAALFTGIHQVFTGLNNEFGVVWVLVFIEMLLMGLLGLVANILLVYLSIAVGQLVSRHKIIGSFGAYIGIYTVLQFILFAVILPFGTFISRHPIENSEAPYIVFPIIIVILAAGCACFYLATNYIFKRKLNLD